MTDISGTGNSGTGNSGTDAAGTDRLAAAVLAEAGELLRISAGRSLTVRLTGSLAVHAHCPGQAPLLPALGRRPYRDIDLIGYSKQKRQIAALFEERGYVLDPAVRQAQEFGLKRFVYEHPDSHLKADVFFDELVMAHTIGFQGRLELDSPTITVTDLLLTKLQIHEITENDLIDCIVLLAEHRTSSGEPERRPADPAAAEIIDVGHVTGIMRKDWGFCHTTQLNLDKIAAALDRYPLLPPEVTGAVRERIVTLADAIEGAPKSQKWKLRARVGDRVRWYEQVEDVTRLRVRGDRGAGPTVPATGPADVRGEPVAGVLQMRAERRLRHGDALPERPEQFLVLPDDRIGCVAEFLLVQPQQDQQFGRVPDEHVVQPGVPAHRADGAVETQVLLRGERRVPGHGPHVLDHPADLGQRFRPVLLNDQPDRRRLQRDAQLVDVPDVLRGELDDEGAAPRLVPDQALLAQQPQCVPDRPAADAQPLGHAGLHDPHPGRQLTGDDQLADGVGRLRAQGLAVQRPEGSHRVARAGLHAHRSLSHPHSIGISWYRWSMLVPRLRRYARAA
jgi:hypothetical protein